MKLYLICRTDNPDYDEYDSFVVAAESYDSAIEWCPDGSQKKDWLDSKYRKGWGDWIPNNAYLDIQCIGESNSPVEKVILASFKAG